MRFISFDPTKSIIQEHQTMSAIHKGQLKDLDRGDV